jgi:hypothetical protein
MDLPAVVPAEVPESSVALMEPVPGLHLLFE